MRYATRLLALAALLALPACAAETTEPSFTEGQGFGTVAPTSTTTQGTTPSDSTCAEGQGFGTRQC